MMGIVNMKRSLLLSTLFGIIFISLIKGENLSFNWNIKVNRTCTIGLYENDKTSEAYKDLKTEVEDGIREVYIGNNNFISSSVQMFACLGEYVMVGELVKVKNISNTELQIFNNLFISAVAHRNSTIMKSIITYNLTASPLLKTTPVLYAKLDGSIGENHFCQYRTTFKDKLANTLILADGVSRAKPIQVILHNHPCGDPSKLLNNVQFYISKEGMIGQPDIALTTMAYRIVEQMIYDGTAWRLGLHLYKYLDKIELMGSARKDRELNDLEITYTGFGAVILLILLVIITVQIVDFSRKRCCKKCCGEQDEADFHVSVSVEPTANEIGITNELFQREKIHAAEPDNLPVSDNEDFEHIEDPMEIRYGTAPVLLLPPPPPLESEYVEFNTKGTYDNHNDMAVMSSFQDGAPITASYENPVESEVMSEELLAPPHFDSSGDESDIDEGKDLNVDDLDSMLADENGLFDEYHKLGNRVPGAILYPEDVVLKNRVPGFFPWPENRVLLYVEKDNDDPLAGYINASFVKDNKGEFAYLCTQAPLESTTDDFWKMIWERNVAVVVMVTPLNLRGKEMCHQYWPRDQTARAYGNIKVQLLKKELKPDFLVTTVVASRGEEDSRHIYLFRYMSWPQSDIPDNPKSIVAFLLEIREVCDTFQSLPVFHCSSGRGMSAVFIALVNGMISLEETNTVNIKKTVRKLRRDLPAAIESFEQYKFLYEVMYQYAVFNAN